MDTMVTVGPLRWPDDRIALATFDTSFLTDHVYQVVCTDHSFDLNIAPAVPPLRKDYGFANDVDTLPTFDHVLVAEIDTTIVGIAAINIEQWNRRANLVHFYVDPAYRGQGIGRRLMDDVTQVAQTRGMRCVWLETQNVNVSAIQFYKQMGFEWCGLDTSLYDSQQGATNEVALFFVRHLTHT